MALPGDARLLERFARLLEYPGSGLQEAARECETLAAEVSSEAGGLLRQFGAFLARTSPGGVEEAYCSTFDLDATCHPYVGYHLFGESYKRSLFMVELRERYQAHGYTADGELPDHLAVLLRFVAAHGDSDLAREIVGEALRPALARLTGRSPSAGYEQELPPEPRRDGTQQHPYRGVLEALRLVLEAAGDGTRGE